MNDLARIPLEDLKVGMFVEAVESTETQCPIKQAGIVRSEAILMALHQYGVRFVLVKPTDHRFTSPEPAGSHEIKAEAETPDHPSPQAPLTARVGKVLDMAKYAENQLKHVCMRIETVGPKDFEVLSHIASDLNAILTEDPVATMMLVRLHDAQPKVYDHSINTALLCGMFAHDMGFEEAICHDLLMAGLLHDVGLSIMPKRILEKQDNLTQQESKILKGHVEVVHEILMAQYPDLSEIALSAIRHHHERMNGSGYPKGLADEDISFWGKILGIVDAYESMTSSRYHAKRMTNNEALAELFKHSGTQFDKALVAMFANFVGAYPAGSCVLCNKQLHNYLGLVTQPNPVFALKPQLVVFYDVDTSRSIPTEHWDLRFEQDTFIEKAVNCEEYTGAIDAFQLLNRLSA